MIPLLTIGTTVHTKRGVVVLAALALLANAPWAFVLWTFANNYLTPGYAALVALTVAYLFVPVLRIECTHAS